MRYLALCLFCRDENSYLSEWLDYHFALGVEHVVVYDNDSIVPLSQTLKPYVAKGLVTVKSWGEKAQGRQCRAYAECLCEHGHEYSWIGFIDTDEFIVPKAGRSLPKFLSEYEYFGGLALFWYCFGSNGHERRPPEGVIAGFTRRSVDAFEANDHVKVLVNTKFVLAELAPNPHCFCYRPGFYAVDEYHRPVLGPRRRPRTSDLIQLNHYVLRSREEFRAKQARGGGNSLWSRQSAFFNEYDIACNLVTDLSIQSVLTAAT